MTELSCFRCSVGSSQKSENCEAIATSSQSNSIPTQQPVSKKIQNNEGESPVYLRCECCQKTWCGNCFVGHQEGKYGLIVCQECQEDNAQKYCPVCEQFLCEKCSFKIHNKGKRAKHKLEQDLQNKLAVRTIVVLDSGVAKHIGKLFQGVKQDDWVGQWIKKELKLEGKWVEMVEMGFEEEFGEDSGRQRGTFEGNSVEWSDVEWYKGKYPLLSKCFIVATASQNSLTALAKQAEDGGKIGCQLVEVKSGQSDNPHKHQRYLSGKLQVKQHVKQVSNFSNFSAISKIEHHSILSNEPSLDMFESHSHSQSQSNELSVTMGQNNSSVLMMGVMSQEEEKKEKEQKIGSVLPPQMHAIREESSRNNSALNASTSTENSIRKRSKRWPIPYFQPTRVPRHDKGAKSNAEAYLRDLAEKGILMIRRQKAESFILDPDLTRQFVRSIGEIEIQYVAYIIDYLSVECLTWVIESIKQDKMTPSQKLVNSRLKESFDLKLSSKMWESIIRYLQSSEYEQDYLDNTKTRYVPKISVVKYADENLLQFQQRKWAYEDQQLLDEQEQEWQQFKQMITEYFSQKQQITGGRYGCVQYVKLNGPKPLRKSSLGKLCMYVQQAINKGIIRYHKTLLVSNSDHNSSVCSGGHFKGNEQLMNLHRDVKIMALQVALIDMFLQNPPNTPISMAQIPLNLKTKIMFEYSLVQLGFPKLKNLLATLNDKLILDSTKTHTSYQSTTNGLEAIEKLRVRLGQASKELFEQVAGVIGMLVSYYHRITLDDLYSQLSARLGFMFQYKIYSMPDFTQFALYYCSNIFRVQFVENTFIAQLFYPSYDPSQFYQTPHNTYKVIQNPPSTQNQHNSYHQIPNKQQNYEQMLWQVSTEDHIKPATHQEEEHSPEIQENVNSLLEDRPPTVIVKNEGGDDGQLFLNKEQDMLDSAIWNDSAETSQEGQQQQHSRVRSDLKETTVKHQRFASSWARK